MKEPMSLGDLELNVEDLCLIVMSLRSTIGELIDQFHRHSIEVDTLWMQEYIKPCDEALARVKRAFEIK